MVFPAVGLTIVDVEGFQHVAIEPAIVPMTAVDCAAVFVTITVAVGEDDEVHTPPPVDTKTY